MKRFLYFTASILVASTGIILSTTVAESQPGAKALVQLQPTTPGTPQTGHANLSGTVVAGQFQGGGSALTGVNADLLGGLNSTAFLLSGAAAGGDLSGTYPNPTVSALQTRPLSPMAPGSGEMLKWDGSAWTPAADGLALPFAGNASVNSGAAIFITNTDTSGFSFGGQFESASTSGIGVRGLASSTSGFAYGVYGRSDSTFGRGVKGLASASSGFTTGVFGESESTSGNGVFGIALSSTGFTHGVWGQSNSTSGVGVRGEATAVSGATYGVWGQSASTSGFGVVGIAYSTTGATTAVYGRSDSPASTAYGVRGVEPSGGSGHAIFASGTLAASGTKSFQIDHPLFPETHYLNHFCSEGPEPYNVYRGNVVTDSKGYATIALPDYFESINRDPTYHLTVIDDSDDFVLAKVVRKAENNQFTIRTSAPRVEVSWRVEAIRNDRYVQEYGRKSIQEKEDEIKGKYLQPELYGMPQEYGIHYRPDHTR